jgi:Phage tail tube protein
MPVQSAEVIGFSPETTFGTFVAPVNFVPGIATINDNTSVARPEQSRGTRDYVVDALTGIQIGATISCEMIPEVISILYAGWMGTGSDTVTGSAEGRVHTLVPKNVVPSYSFEVDHDVTSQVLARQLVGCNVDQIAVKFTQQALVTNEFQVIGQREITPTTPGLPSNPTPTINSQQPIDFSRLTATYKGTETTQLQDATLTLMNHVQRVYSSNKNIYVVRLVPTRREVQFQTTLDFLDTTFYNDWIKGEQTSGFTLLLETAYTIPGSASKPFKIEFTIPKTRPQGQYNLASASDVLNQQITWSAVLAGAGVVTSVWTNAETAKLA